MATSVIEAAGGRETSVDWDAVDALFRYVESPLRPDPTLNGFALCGFVAGAVLLDAGGDADAWWQLLFPHAHAPTLDRARRGFSENWRDVDSRFRRGRFAPVVADGNDPDHRSSVADFCHGVLRALNHARRNHGRGGGLTGCVRPS
jgi:hypothetical protein